MNGWWVAFIIALVLGVIVSNLMLLKYSAKFKVPKEVIDAVNKRKSKEAQLKDKKNTPTDE
jgi:hypothetical protein